ncbi:hypothetical protein AB4Z18_18120 [Leifsonia sp. 2TAF2]|uniref:hypothetical protein n=1 Tax=Leifsonia sp. 2TAF2 TaxID=3233009 RepID=UPI003F947EF7
MRSRSRPEWVDGDEEVLPAVSTSSLAFQAVLDDLVRAVDAPELAAPPAAGVAPLASDLLPSDLAPPVPPASVPPAPPISAPSTSDEAVSGESWLESAASGDILSRLDEVESAGPPPARLRGRGDLTLVVGLGADADAAARVLAASADAGAEVHRLADRRDALAARADGVRRGIPVVAAFALTGPTAVPDVAAELAGIAPDQVWVAVDVSRTYDDTAAWVRAVDAVLAVDAVAATGASFTASPHTVHQLGLPVLWLDAPPGG